MTREQGGAANRRKRTALSTLADLCVRREHKEEAVPAERSALSEAQRAWPGA
jgi:hypothetical protein